MPFPLPLIYNAFCLGRTRTLSERKPFRSAKGREGRVLRAGGLGGGECFVCVE